jgi:hypothetical protein
VPWDGVPDKYSGKLGLRRTRVLLEVTENNDVIYQRSGLAMKFADAFSERTDIALAFHTKSFASLGYLMTVMKILDRLLEADCDAQSDDDCGNVNEE